ncbi:HD domain-containing protein [Ruminococcus sp. Marseille-P6503]|uniref:HD domain-containing protein n=1 Tax=Ruminococcus sp. Marseille-P6503 TaxID=2364796 RepID=UPI0013DE66F3|nr:HD domain-containing protein [Ruminococcus sp. Marseille-P6503]
MNNYFLFSESERKYLESVNLSYDEALSPYASKNDSAVRRKTPRYDIIRPQYSYDVDCILYNPLYNRYADKTQVFSFYKNDDLTRRALHVQLVSKIARTIGRALKLNLDLIEAIALGHDMGHTPFGHKGEEFLSISYQKGCRKTGVPVRYFNHNVHSARLFRYVLGTNISLQTLSGILSHNGEKGYKEYTPSTLNTFDEFDELLEQCYLEDKFHKRLRPNTLEGCVVRISDRIAYAGKDRQDMFHAKMITETKFKESRLIGTRNSDIISNLIINLIKNSIDSPSLNMDKEVFDDFEDLISENNKIYSSDELNEPYYKIIRPLMFKLYDRLLDDVISKNYNSPIFKHHLNNTILGNCYRDKTSRRIIADPNEAVVDFIASMSDDYFIDICRYLHIDDQLVGEIKYHEYF